MEREILIKKESVKFAVPVILAFGIFSLLFGLGLFSFHGQPIYLETAKLLVSISGLLYIISGIFLFKLKNMLAFGIFSLLFGLGLFSFKSIFIYYIYYTLVIVYLIVNVISLFKLKNILILGMISVLFGLELFLFRGQPVYLIEASLISITGLAYIITSFFLLRLKNWSVKSVLFSSIILLIYFIPLSLYLLFDPWGWGPLVVHLFLPYILFPLFFIIFLSRPKIKEIFRNP